VGLDRVCVGVGGGLLVRWVCLQANLPVCFFFAGWVLTVRRLFLMLRVESDGQIDE